MRILRLLPRFRRAEQALDDMAAREQWTRQQIEAWQLDLLNRMWRLATSKTAYYRSLVAKQELPAEFSSLGEFTQRVPILNKSIVRGQPESFCQLDAQPGRWLRSGGSTGTPMRIFWTNEAHLLNLQTRYRWYQQWGFDAHDRQTFLWGHAGSFAHGINGVIQRVKQPILDRLRGRQRLSAYRLSPDDLDHYLQKIKKFQPASIYGYSSAVDVLARRAQQTGQSLDFLKAALLTGEPAYESTIHDVEAGLGCPAIREYGSVECGILANEDASRQLRVREDRFFLETIPFDDVSYRIVITGLMNSGFPLFRYPLGDLTPGCLVKPDRGFATLSQIQGRDNDFVVAKSGRLVHANGVKHIFEQVDAIRRFRVAQDEHGNVKALLESTEDAIGNAQLDTMAHRLTQLVEGFPVQLEVVDLIAGNRAGKHRWVTSEMARVEQTVTQVPAARC